MNERIRELAEQSREKKYDYGAREGESHYIYVFNEEKFAELIVKECQTRVEQYICDCGEIGSLPDAVIMKHFGVEE